MRRLVVLLSLVMPLTSFAKVGDCPAILVDGVRYASHANHVQAERMSDGVLLWRTTLFADVRPARPDPSLEEDVQWNLACLREVRGRDVVVTDSRGRVYRVARRSGKRITEHASGARK